MVCCKDRLVVFHFEKVTGKNMIIIQKRKYRYFHTLCKMFDMVTPPKKVKWLMLLLNGSSWLLK